MTNMDVMSIRDFRRFANGYIYHENIDKLIYSIKERFGLADGDISFDSISDFIKFKYNDKIFELNENNESKIIKVHSILNGVFINFFNDNDISKEFNKKIIGLPDVNQQLLSTALFNIQIANMQFVSVLFNITLLNDCIYVYL